MTSSLDSFKSRRTLTVGGADLRLLQPARRREERARRHFAPALLAEGAAREPAPPRGRPHGHRRRHPRHGRLADHPHERPRDRLPPGARADAGFHRRAGGGRPRRHARRHGRARRRPGAHQPAGAGRSRHRPLGDGRRVRHRRAPSARTSSANTSATASATSSCAGASRPSSNFRVVPPGTGICHQVNLEYLAQTVWTGKEDGRAVAYPDTLVGTDSHTTMVNGLAVLGWGVGGIEAEAAMLGQPISMLIPEVVGFRLTGRLNEGVTATDLVLTVTEMLRKKGVVGKFVEFYGAGLVAPVAGGPATIANMAPEYGATCGFFPVDKDTLAYLKATGRDADRVALVEAYAKAQGLFRTDDTPDPVFTDTLALDLATVVPSLAGPKRPQDRVAARPRRHRLRGGARQLPRHQRRRPGLRHGRGRRRLGARAHPHSRRSTGKDYRLDRRRRRHRRDHLVHQHLQPERADRRRPARPQGPREGPDQQALGEDLAGAGLAGGHRLSRPAPACRTTSTRSASTSSATAAPPASAIPARCRGDLRGDQTQGPGRRLGALRQPQLRGPRQPRYARQLPRLAAAGGRLCARRLACASTSPPSRSAPARTASRSTSRTSGRRRKEIADLVRATITDEMFRTRYADVFKGDEHWRKIKVERRPDLSTGPHASTYVQNPPYFDGMTHEAGAGRPTSSTRASSASSSTRSPPTTSRRPARSSATARPATT